MRDFSRQQDLVPTEQVRNSKVTIIGVGAVGRNVAIQLAGVGVGEIQLIDHDSVEQTNVTTQGFTQRDIGLYKTEAIAALIKTIDTEIKVSVISDIWKPKLPIHEVVFVCVDSIRTREKIFNSLEGKVKLLIDGRMLGEVMSVYKYTGNEPYRKTMFSDAEIQQGSCTAKSTLYCATTCASLMVAQFSKYLREWPLEFNVNLNLLTMEMSAE